MWDLYFPDHGSNPYSQHWKVDSLPLATLAWKELCASLGCILKCRFYYYLHMARSTHQETLPLKRQLVVLRDPDGREHAMTGHTGNHQSWSGGRRIEGEAWVDPSLGLLQEGKGQARWAGLGMASLNNSSRFWGVKAVPSYLVSRLGVMRAGRW